MARQRKIGYSEPPAEGTMKIKQLIKPRSENQRLYYEALKKHTIVFGVGPAGTGKTFMAVAHALKLLSDGEIERIIITRPIVGNDEDLGFLPGDVDEKMAPWVRPIKDSVQEIVGGRSTQKLFADGTIEVCPLGFMKGRTFKNAMVIADEMSNSTPSQMKNLLTRLGEGSRMVILGDPYQCDLPDHVDDGLTDFLDLHNNYNGATGGLSVIRLYKKDIIRHALIPMILDIYDEDDEDEIDIQFEDDLGKLPN